MPTDIEWADETWNPVIGCSPASSGCANCYAERMAARLAVMLPDHQYHMVTDYVSEERDEKDKFSGWNGRTAFVESALEKPLRSWRSKRIFVCSMGDLFHETVPLEWIDRVFAVMAMCPQHTFMILTKRPERMAEYFQGIGRLPVDCDRDMTLFDGWRGLYGSRLNDRPSWPMLNVWLGTTAENQEQANKRIPELLKCPAAVRFLSVEPMLGPVDLETCFWKARHGCKTYPFNLPLEHRTKVINVIDWVICGGESGPGARPMHPIWVRDLRDQCKAAAVPFMFKQWGEWGDMADDWTGRNGCRRHVLNQPYTIIMARCGKKKAGRVLDGVTHDEFPGK